MSSKKINSDSIRELTSLIDGFCQERDWDQFHTLKDLAIGAVTEASELLEWFRFQSDADIKNKLANSEHKEMLADELADSLYFLLRLAQKADIDLGQAVCDKQKKNALKYPIKTAFGSNQKPVSK